MKPIEITKAQAKAFILEKQGLLGMPIYKGENGVCDFIKNAGCIQFDPIDVCGKNAELVLHARVHDFKKAMLDHLLYDKRHLLDHWDKCMSIIPTCDFPRLKHARQHLSKAYEPYVKNHPALEIVRQTLEKNNGIRHTDLPIDEDVNFFNWRHRKLSQALLDYLYFKGEALIHHKQGTTRFFDLANKHLDSALLKDDATFTHINAYYRWLVLRRIGAVGMLWDKASDVFVGVHGFKQNHRKNALSELQDENCIIPVKVKGLVNTFYVLTDDYDVLMKPYKASARIEFIAPLDNFIWDRKMIAALFDFDYVWEIYMPKHKRQYGHYVLPVLYKTNLIGRIELSADYKSQILHVSNLWIEKPVDKEFITAFEKKCDTFARFANCITIKKSQTVKRALSHAVKVRESRKV